MSIQLIIKPLSGSRVQKVLNFSTRLM